MDDKEIKISFASISNEIWKVFFGLVATGVLLAVSFYYNTNTSIERIKSDVDRIQISLDEKADKESVSELKKDVREINVKMDHLIDLYLNQKQRK